MEWQKISEKAKTHTNSSRRELHVCSFIYEMETIMVISILHEGTKPPRLSHVPKATQPGNSRDGNPPVLSGSEAGFPGQCLLLSASSCCLAHDAYPLLIFLPQQTGDEGNPPEKPASRGGI